MGCWCCGQKLYLLRHNSSPSRHIRAYDLLLMSGWCLHFCPWTTTAPSLQQGLHTKAKGEPGQHSQLQTQKCGTTAAQFILFVPALAASASGAVCLPLHERVQDWKVGWWKVLPLGWRAICSSPSSGQEFWVPFLPLSAAHLVAFDVKLIFP